MMSTRDQRIAGIRAAEKQYVDEEVEHFLYRCYDADGRLLYIGCTQDVVARMMVHQSAWDNPASAYLNLYMTRREVEGPFVGRLAGRAAEKAAIAAEAPLLNVHHNQGRGERVLPQPSPLTVADREQLAAVLSTFFDGTSLRTRMAS